MKTKEKTHLQFTLTMALAGLSVATSLFAIISVQKASVSGVSTSVAAIYYVDSSAGNDTNPGTETLPWKSFAKIATTPLKGGDQVLLKKGSVWNEQLTINSSGSSGNPIKIGSYGSGSAQPLIDGVDQLPYGVFILDRDYVTISDIAVTRTLGTNGAGIGIGNSNNIVIDRVQVANIKGTGGVLVYSSVPGRGEKNIVRNSEISSVGATAEAMAGNNAGNGIQLWSEVPAKSPACANAMCGRDNVIENNTLSGNGDHGIGVFMPYTTVRENTVRNNDESGISASGSNAHHTTIDGNAVSGNCQKTDDCFGINLFRAGASNVVKNNTVSRQKDTISDSSIKPNEDYLGMKFGTGGIRFDGGDSTLVNKPELGFGMGSDYMSASGNQISGNTILDEHDAIQVYNYDGVVVSNNTISDSDRWAVNASAMNSVLGNVTPPLELSIVGGVLMAKWSGKPAVSLESITKPITVTIQNNTITGKGVNTAKATVIGDVSPEPIPDPSPEPTADTIAPVITLVGNAIITITKGQSWVDPGYAVSDVGDQNPTVSVSGSVNANTVGTYVISYSARDASGNESMVVKRTVIVKDVSCTTARYYRDADGDGYGVGSYKNLCSTDAAGYVTNNKDCNDSAKATCSRPGLWCSKTCYKR